jgi:hypothetical protein
LTAVEEEESARAAAPAPPLGSTQSTPPAKKKQSQVDSLLPPTADEPPAAVPKEGGPALAASAPIPVTPGDLARSGAPWPAISAESRLVAPRRDADSEAPIRRSTPAERAARRRRRNLILFLIGILILLAAAILLPRLKHRFEIGRRDCPGPTPPAANSDTAGSRAPL